MKRKCPNRDGVLTAAAKKLAALRAENRELIVTHDKMARRMLELESRLEFAEEVAKKLAMKCGELVLDLMLEGHNNG